MQIKTVDIGAPPKEDQPDSKNTDKTDDEETTKKSNGNGKKVNKKADVKPTKTAESTGEDSKKPKETTD